MRMLLTFSAAMALTAFAWAGAPNTVPLQRKAPANKAAAAAVKKAAASASSRRSAKAAPVRSTWRYRQSAPTPERYQEIQSALAARGYLSEEDANGSWGPSSLDALKKFQSDQTLEETGKIDSLSLIALGLGPKHDSPVPITAEGNFVQPEAGRN